MRDIILLINFILLLWGITSLLYALIKQHQDGIIAFVILTPNVYISLSNFVYFHLPILV